MLTASSPSLASGTETFYYILAIILALSAIIGGGYQFYRRQRRKWTEEGEVRAKQARAVEENNRQLQENTSAVTQMTTKFTEFVAQVNEAFAGHGRRLDRLEEYMKAHGREHGRDT